MRRFKYDYYNSITNNPKNTIEECGENTEAQIRFIKYNYTVNEDTNSCLYAETLRGKKLVYCRYRSAKDRDFAYDMLVNSSLRHKEAIESRKKARKEFVTDVKVDDIFVYSWGYEQTNKNFFQVVDVKGNTLKLKEIASKSAPGNKTVNYMTDYVVAIPNKFIDSHFYPENKDGVKADHLTKRITSKDYINMSFGCMFKWDGKQEYVSWYA